MAESDLSQTAALARDEGADGLVRLAAEGDWCVQTVARLEAEVERAVAAAPKEAVIDLAKVAILDTAGAWLIDRLARELEAAGTKVSWAGLSETATRLLKAVGPTPEAVTEREAGLPFWLAPLDRLGRVIHEIGTDLLAGLSLLGGSARGFAIGLTNPRRLRIVSIFHHLDRVFVQGVPIVALIGFLVGAIIAQQAAFYFSDFGADLFVVDMVGLLVLRELGVILTAIMIAGRSGSAFTAEIGSMKMREEIDALTVIGIDPAEVLVLPRLIAMVIAVPLLTIVADLMALVGGAFVCLLYIDMSPETYISRLHSSVGLNAFFVGIIKAPFMAAVIAVIAASEGLKVGGSADSLGHQTTISVVKGIFMIIVIDGLFAAFFAGIGY